MLLNDAEVEARLVSPLNLINRLKPKTASLQDIIKPGNTPATIVSIPPAVDDIVDNLEDKIKRAALCRRAEALADAAIGQLSSRLEEVNVNRLGGLAKDMSSIVNNIRGDNKDHGAQVQVVVYAPQIISAENFQAIHVQE